ncbi:MAG: catecholate siderophore receptor, partial [Acidobacteriota bacterium]|nr:catecholate siderophore receptor [Acidobacteriota bacterium]
MRRLPSHGGISFTCTSLLFCVLITGLLTCQAQSSQFQLRGKVLDQNHAAVAGARVTADLTSQASAISATTDATGQFVLTLVPDKYELTIVADGFAPAKQTVELSRDGHSSLEIVLQVAGTSDSVTVLAAGGYLTDVIGSATKTLTALRDVPQSISVVTKEQIDDQLMLSIGDVVRYTPGLSAHQGENNRDQIIFRGQSSSADFFLNGVRDDVQYYRDLYNLDRLETLKGPNAMIFGRGGGGGVINRVTKEAGFSPLREVSVMGGSFFSRRIAGDFDQPLNHKIAFRLNSVYENSRSFRRFVNLHRFAINPTFSFVPSSATRITFGYEYAGDRRTADRGITSFHGEPADVPISTFYGDPNNSHVRSNVNLWTGATEHQVGKLNIHNRTLFGDYDRFYQNYVPGAPDANKTLVTLTAYNNSTKRRNIFNQTDLSYVIATRALKHTLLGGFEFGRQVTANFRNTGFFNNATTSINVPYVNPTTNTPTTFRQNATDADNHLRANLGAAYLQDQIEVSRYLQIVVGLRHDYFDLHYHNNRTGDALRRIDNLVSPRLGVVLKPFESLSVYGSYSVSYLPSSGDQFSSLTTVTEQIKPEKFTNFEDGVKWDLRRNLSFTS